MSTRSVGFKATRRWTAGGSTEDMGGLVWRDVMVSFVVIANLAPVGGQPEATKSVQKYALRVTSFLNRN